MSRREFNKAEKRRRMEEAGLRVFLADGFAGASIERVVEDAQVARGTFYLYFPDKAALFRAVVDALLAPTIGAVEAARDALRGCPDIDSTFPVYVGLGIQLAGILGERRDALRLYFAEARATGPGGEILREYVARLEALTADILADAAARGVLRTHDVHAVALAIFGGVERLAWAWVSGDPELDAAGLPEEITRLFRYGLAP